MIVALVVLLFRGFELLHVSTKYKLDEKYLMSISSGQMTDVELELIAI